MPTPHYGQPRYRAIADELRERIETGAIPMGTLLPPESALAAEFRASRGTIRQAIAVLREELIVATEHGRGTYATPRAFEGMLGEASESETQQRHVAADPELAALFAVEVGSLLVEQQIVTQTSGTVWTVARIYRRRPSQGHPHDPSSSA
ncbi:GntR family transcriptional regulator [Micromonospora sp. NPDC049374]|uniref:GntR family transcriptional regulator n=1 Tax=Micromonospora sp. NPDC049374 TaxID=3154352 RepID=UPI003446923F